MNNTEYRKTREALLLTQSDLANLLGLSRVTINRREAGAARFPITGEAALALAAVTLLVEQQVAEDRAERDALHGGKS